jgi:hypothetical protein
MVTRFRPARAPLDRAVVAGLSIGLLIAGVAAAVNEAQPFLAFSGSDSDRMLALQSLPLPVSQSAVGRRVVLDTCLWATTSVYGRLSAPDQRQSMLATCEQFAADTLEHYPTHSFAAYIAALDAAALSDQQAFVSYLSRSQDLGQNEGWIAELRVPLAEDHLDWLDQHAREGHDGDLAMLAQTHRGIALVAGLYLRGGETRDRITAIIASLPTEAQQLFVAAVRQVLAKRST